MNSLGLGPSQPLAIVSTGMVTGVGLCTASSCAAIRAAIDNFRETRFMDAAGEWIQGSEVPLEEPWRGTRKLAKMLARALSECAEQGVTNLSNTPILLCLAEKERPGRPERLAERLLFDAQQELGITFHSKSAVVEQGRVSGIIALKLARAMIYGGEAEQVIIAGVDSLLTAHTLQAFDGKQRLLTSLHSDGFIPGEAAAAFLVKAPVTASDRNQLLCLGVGLAVEAATLDSGLPLRADGLTSALRHAFSEGNTSMDDMDFRIVDVAGEQYWFKETALVLSRLLRAHKRDFPLWHLTDCIGETGSAITILSIAYLKMAFDKGFAPGLNAVFHASNDDGKRAAAVFRYCEHAH